MLRKRRYPGQGVVCIQLIRCPCGYEFDDGESRADHFLEDHTVADFLPPAGNGGDR